MGVVIQAESRMVEFAGVYLMEHDAEVLEFWDQPGPPITVEFRKAYARVAWYDTIRQLGLR